MDREITRIRQAREQAELRIKALHNRNKKNGRIPVYIWALISLLCGIAIGIITIVVLYDQKSSVQAPGRPQAETTAEHRDRSLDTVKKQNQVQVYWFVELPKDSIVRQGEMLVMMAGKKLSLPLIHTEVSGVIDGFCARVTVMQKFVNPGTSTIEALYTFPLPENAAVDSMFMQIGHRRIMGIIKERGEARAIYEQARREGKTASLLEQERPNIFSQSVANILKNDTILITISYVQVLTYRNGSYRFYFPMVVGPRYIPGNPARVSSRSAENPTDQVPDADRITPSLVAPQFRSGHEISLTLNINAGTSVTSLHCPSHKTTESIHPNGAWTVSIASNDQIPNKDFILEYGVAGNKINTIILTHRSSDTGFFQLILVPKIAVQEKEIFPRELVFVVDNSGSMQGFPVDKCKEIVALCIKKMRPDDVFRLVTFANETQQLSSRPLYAGSENREKALAFIDRMHGAGGTEMMGAINAIFDAPTLDGRKRLVFFLTDGLIGNDQAIISSIRDRLGDTRVFSMGVGSSPNRYLIESMAYVGKGSALFIRQDGDASKAMDEFYSLIDAPVLTNIALKVKGVEVFDLLPQCIPDLFAAQPLVITGKYKDQGKGVFSIEGALARGKSYSENISMEFPKKEPAHAVLATLWARTKIAEYDLFGGRLVGDQAYTPDEIKERITVLGLKYRIMTHYTSFVAVDKLVRNTQGKWVPVEQAVDLPEGVSPASQPGYRYSNTGCITRQGVLGILSGQTTYGSQGGYSSGIDALINGTNGLHRGSNCMARKSSSGIGYGAGYGSGFGGSGSGTGTNTALAQSLRIQAPSLASSGCVLTGGRSKQSIMRVVMQNLPGLRYAYYKRLREKPGLNGAVTVEIKIDYSGTVISCKIVTSTLNDPELEIAIINRIKRWMFEEIENKNDVTVVTYPFIFSK